MQDDGTLAPSPAYTRIPKYLFRTLLVVIVTGSYQEVLPVTNTTILREQVIRLAEVGCYLPTGRNGKHLSLSVALRWVVQGVKLPDGQRLRLEAIRVGGKWVTSCSLPWSTCGRR